MFLDTYFKKIVENINTKVLFSMLDETTQEQLRRQYVAQKSVQDPATKKANTERKEGIIAAEEAGGTPQSLTRLFPFYENHVFHGKTPRPGYMPISEAPKALLDHPHVKPIVDFLKTLYQVNRPDLKAEDYIHVSPFRNTGTKLPDEVNKLNRDDKRMLYSYGEDIGDVRAKHFKKVGDLEHHGSFSHTKSIKADDIQTHINNYLKNNPGHKVEHLDPKLGIKGGVFFQSTEEDEKARVTKRIGVVDKQGKPVLEPLTNEQIRLQAEGQPGQFAKQKTRPQVQREFITVRHGSIKPNTSGGFDVFTKDDEPTKLGKVAGFEKERDTALQGVTDKYVSEFKAVGKEHLIKHMPHAFNFYLKERAGGKDNIYGSVRFNKPSNPFNSAEAETPEGKRASALAITHRQAMHAQFGRELHHHLASTFYDAHIKPNISDIQYSAVGFGKDRYLTHERLAVSYLDKVEPFVREQFDKLEKDHGIPISTLHNKEDLVKVHSKRLRGAVYGRIKSIVAPGEERLASRIPKRSLERLDNWQEPMQESIDEERVAFLQLSEQIFNKNPYMVYIVEKKDDRKGNPTRIVRMGELGKPPASVKAGEGTTRSEAPASAPPVTSPQISASEAQSAIRTHSADPKNAAKKGLAHRIIHGLFASRGFDTVLENAIDYDETNGQLSFNHKMFRDPVNEHEDRARPLIGSTGLVISGKSKTGLFGLNTVHVDHLPALFNKIMDHIAPEHQVPDAVSKGTLPTGDTEEDAEAKAGHTKRITTFLATPMPGQLPPTLDRRRGDFIEGEVSDISYDLSKGIDPYSAAEHADYEKLGKGGIRREHPTYVSSRQRHADLKLILSSDNPLVTAETKAAIPKQIADLEAQFPVAEAEHKALWTAKRRYSASKASPAAPVSEGKRNITALEAFQKGAFGIDQQARHKKKTLDNGTVIEEGIVNPGIIRTVGRAVHRLMFDSAVEDEVTNRKLNPDDADSVNGVMRSLVPKFYRERKSQKHFRTGSDLLDHTGQPYDPNERAGELYGDIASAHATKISRAIWGKAHQVIYGKYYPEELKKQKGKLSWLDTHTDASNYLMQHREFARGTQLDKNKSQAHSRVTGTEKAAIKDLAQDFQGGLPRTQRQVDILVVPYVEKTLPAQIAAAQAKASNKKLSAEERAAHTYHAQKLATKIDLLKTHFGLHKD